MVLKGRRVLYGLEKAQESSVVEGGATRVSGKAHACQENVQFLSKSCLTKIKERRVKILKFRFLLITYKYMY